MRSSTSTIAHHMLFSSTGHLVIRILIFLMVLNGIPMQQVGRQYQWEPDGARWLIQQVFAHISLPDAAADEIEPCTGNLNGDGQVDHLDLALLVEGFGSADGIGDPVCLGDYYADGDVDGSDLAILAMDFNTTGCNGETPLPPGSFGGTYQHLIPPDASLPRYDLERFAVTTGRVQDAAGSPLSGVSVSVLNHPEYGSAVSDGEGRFFLPVLGGAKLTLRYVAAGYIEAQRDVDVPWSDFAVVETPALIPFDTAHTTLAFDGNPDTALVHVGSTTSDADGSREAVVAFAGDTTATAVAADGGTTPLIGPLTVRATEFTTPASMPAILPPTSGFTYCVELSIDEAGDAASVEFSRPVLVFLRNFIGFDVGMVVPVGTYDRGTAQWIPEDDGRVVRLLDTDSNGTIDALDADGDDLADDLDNDGDFADEVFGVEASGQYLSGDTVWRVATTHFTVRDFNCSLSLPGDAIGPNPPKDPYEGDDSPPPPCKQPVGSAIDSRQRVLHEELDLPGTDFFLHYASDRTSDYVHRIIVPASGDTVPASLDTIIVQVEVAGRVLRQELAPAPNLTAEIVWDGRDALGNSVRTSVTALIRLGFAYRAYYSTLEDWVIQSRNIVRTFAIPGNYATPYGRGGAVMWTTHQLPIPVYNAAIDRAGLGAGWTLSPHHHLITGTETVLVRGDGSRMRTPEGQDMVWTVAGTGTAGFSGDDGPAGQAQLDQPTDVAVDSQGRLYIAEHTNCRIRRVDTDGTITTVAGTGYWGSGPFQDGIAAVDETINYPSAVAVGPDDSFYIVHNNQSVVRRVDADGIITTVAGGADSGWVAVNGTAMHGDGGPATDADLRYINDIEIGPDGSIYIVHGYQWNNVNQGVCVIRKVDPTGTIQTIAGRGPDHGAEPVGYDGIGGIPAYETILDVPQRISLDPEGRLLICDPGNAGIRRLDGDGLVRTVGGDYAVTEAHWVAISDGGPALSRWDAYPNAVVSLPEGGYYAFLYWGWNDSQAVIRVDGSGILHAYAGRWDGGWEGYAGDGGPAIDAKFYHASGLALDPKGYLYAADHHNHAVRKLGPAITAEDPGVDPLTEILIPECADCADYSGQVHVFDKGGKHLRTIDLDTGKVLYTFAYDGNDRLIAVTDRFGNATTIGRDAGGRALSITGPYGDVTDLTIDASDTLTGVAYADGSGTDFTYTDGLLTAKLDPVGESFGYSFDANGRFTGNSDPAGGGLTVTSNTAADNTVTTTLISTEGRVTTYADLLEPSDRFVSEISGPDGVVDTYSLDANRFGSQRTDADGMAFVQEKLPDNRTAAPFVSEQHVTTPGGLTRTLTVDRAYGADSDLDGRPDSITVTSDINGRTHTRVQDLSAHTVTSTTPLSRVVTRTYDPTTLLTERLSVSGLADVDYAYDSHGRLNQIIQGGRQTDLVYNGAYLHTVTNALSETVTYHRDAIGRINGLTLADTTYWDIGRDANGNLTVLTEPDGSTDHHFTYTPMGLLENYTSPLGAIENFTYDRDGLLTRRAYASGSAIDWQYNAKGQLGAVQTPEGDHSFTYDADTGHLTQALSRDSQQVAFTYDGSLVIQAAWSGVVAATVDTAYDDALRVTQLDYAGLSLPFSWDDDDLLTGVGSIAITRDVGNGLVTGIGDGGFAIAYTRNAYGEIATTTATHGATLYDVNSTYDDLGRISQKTETIGGGTHTWTYGYDAVGQLIQVARDTVIVETYDFDATGNRIGITNSLTGVTLTSGDFSYDADNKLLAAGTTAYTYDADGRLHQVIAGTDTTTYTYNTDGTLAAVDLPDGRHIAYLYDHLGRRIARSDNGVRTHAWFYGDGLMPLAEYDSGGSLTKSFIYAGGPVPVAYVQGGSTYHIVADHLGSPRLVVNDTGTVVKQIDYDAFGNVIADSDPGLFLCFGFAGGLADPDHELIRFGVRDYQPSSGRWTARDPIFFGGGLNLYGYVNEDPVNFNDLRGWFSAAVSNVTGVAVTGIGIAPVGIGIKNRTNAINNIIGAIRNKNYSALNQGLDCYERANQQIRIGADAFQQVGNFTPDPESFAAGVAQNVGNALGGAGNGKGNNDVGPYMPDSNSSGTAAGGVNW